MLFSFAFLQGSALARVPVAIFEKQGSGAVTTANKRRFFMVVMFWLLKGEDGTSYYSLQQVMKSKCIKSIDQRYHGKSGYDNKIDESYLPAESATK